METSSNEKSWRFYLMGREERRLIKHTIDLHALAIDLVQEHHPRDDRWHDVLIEKCRTAAKEISTRTKNDWLRENASAITAAGLRPEQAYDAYLAGRVDELRYALEEELIERLADVVGDDDDDEGGGSSVH